MKRIPARDAAALIGVQPQTIHKWVRQGWLTRHADGYDIPEILAAERNRNYAMLCVRAGLERKDWPDDPALDDTPRPAVA